MKFLFVTQHLPYSNVPHAGGRTCYYYIHEIAKTNDVFLVSRCGREEKKALPELSALLKKVIPVHREPNSSNTVLRALQYARRILDILLGRVESIFIPHNEYQSLLKAVKEILHSRDIDLIQLEWTESLALVPFVRKTAPTIPIIASEHDVSFLRYLRQYKRASNLFSKVFFGVRYWLTKKLELKLLDSCDLILTHSRDDKALLEANGVKTPIHTIVPFFSRPKEIQKVEKIRHSLLFVGAMYRSANYNSMLWFIREILPQISEKVPKVKLYIVGNKPPQRLQELSDGQKVIVTGFVPSLEEYYRQCEVFVAPLLCGAGIKVKILEAMAYGLPVVTNNIGIEGIPATSGKDVMLYNSPKELCDIVVMLLNDPVEREVIGKNGRKLVAKHFDLEKSLQHLCYEYRRLIK